LFFKNIENEATPKISLGTAISIDVEEFDIVEEPAPKKQKLNHVANVPTSANQTTSRKIREDNMILYSFKLFLERRQHFRDLNQPRE
jgi:hypothetical protein